MEGNDLTRSSIPMLKNSASGKPTDDATNPSAKRRVPDNNEQSGTSFKDLPNEIKFYIMQYAIVSNFPFPPYPASSTWKPWSYSQEAAANEASSLWRYEWPPIWQTIAHEKAPVAPRALKTAQDFINFVNDLFLVLLDTDTKGAELIPALDRLETDINAKAQQVLKELDERKHLWSSWVPSHQLSEQEMARSQENRMKVYAKMGVELWNRSDYEQVAWARREMATLITAIRSVCLEGFD